MLENEHMSYIFFLGCIRIRACHGIYKNYRWNVAVNSRYLPSGQKTTSFGQKGPQQTIWLRKVTIYLNI